MRILKDEDYNKLSEEASFWRRRYYRDCDMLRNENKKLLVNVEKLRAKVGRHKAKIKAQNKEIEKLSDPFHKLKGGK